MSDSATRHELARAIHDGINAVRIDAGFAALCWDEHLAQVAEQHSLAMVEHQFFSHYSPLTGLETPSDRATVGGREYEAVGENLARLDAESATAPVFVDKWLKSPGHRDNFMKPLWERSGVGVHLAPDRSVMATQLFAIAPKVTLNRPKVTIQERCWTELHMTAKVGLGNELCAFVRNEFVTSAIADRAGVARLEIALPTEPGRYHVGLGRRLRDTQNSWIGIYEGIAEVRKDATAVWHPASGAHDDFLALEERLFLATGSVIHLELSGLATQDALCVVDGAVHAKLEAGHTFALAPSFRTDGGAHTVDFGIACGDGQYTPCRRLEIDGVTGYLRSVK